MKISFLEIRWTDILDIVLVAILLYNIYKLVRGSIASRVFIGYMLVYLSYLIVRAIGLELLTKILEYFMGVGAIALIVLFQQEIRRFLMIIGKTTNSQLMKNFFNTPTENPESKFPLKAITDAAKTMSNECTGGLIAIQKDDDLSKYIESGDALDGILSKRLLLSIFNQYSPLHDGAVIVAEGRITAARCILPVSDGEDLPASYGFRHRAAVGLTEVTDSVVVIISEETGKISVAFDGKINPVPASALEDKLKHFLYEKK